MLEHINIGEKNKCSRSELMALTGYSDRKVRKEIEKLQLQGYSIVNLDGGYFIADGHQLAKYCARERRRAKEINKKISAMVSNDL